VAATALVAACITPEAQREATRVRALSPRPMVDLPKRDAGLELVLGEAVRDSFEYSEPGWITGIPVESWRESLRNGFDAGPGKSFAADASASKRFKLAITNAELTWVASAMFARGGNVVGPAAMHARVKYTARLESPSGGVIGRLQGEAFSTNPWVQQGGTATTAAEALTAMYEEISAKLIAPWADKGP
jgi:hypothetical protein